jgi:hypothetical protein
MTFEYAYSPYKVNLNRKKKVINIEYNDSIFELPGVDANLNIIKEKIADLLKK